MGDGGSNCLTLQITGPDLVRRTGNHLLCAQNAVPNQAPDHVMTYAKKLGGHARPILACVSAVRSAALLASESSR